MNRFRIGYGYDVHRLVEGRPLIIGGVEIPYAKGALGHSDADVLIHAIVDAMLGAVALGDIGQHFPDTDEKLKGISSTVILAEACKLLLQNGYELGNIDSTVVLQEPKIAQYIPIMVGRIAETMGIEKNQVSVKATTTEHCGFEGRGEGIAATAVVLVYKL